MGLASDIEEVKLLWGKSSILGKIFLIFSLFLSSNAIASISETFIQWKGFILDSLVFYHSYISEPLRELLNTLFSYKFSIAMINLFILFFLILFSNIRLLFQIKTDSSIIYDNISHLLAMAIFLGILFLMGELDFSKNTILIPIIGALSLTTYRYWKIGGEIRMFWFINIIIPLSLVGFLGAINKAFIS